MTTETQIPTIVGTPDLRVSALSAVDRTFDPDESCARCGPGTRAQVKWVFPPISEFTREHRDLYLCAHCSSMGERRLRTTSIFTVDRAHDQH